MSEEPKFDPEAIAEFKIDGATRSFANFAEFKEWHTQEMEFAEQTLRQENQLRRRFSPDHQQIDLTIRNIDEKRGNRTAHYADLKVHVERLYSFVIPTDTPRGKLIQQLAQENELSACGAYAYFRGVEDVVHHNDPRLMGGVARAALFEAFPDEDISSLREALNEQQSQVQDWLNDHRRRVHDLEADLGNQIQLAIDSSIAVDDRSKEHRKRLRRIWRRFRKRVQGQYKVGIASADKQIERLQTDIDNLKKTYDADLALRAPTTYWKRKQEFHEKRAFWFSWAFGICLALAFVLVSALSLLLIFPVEQAVAEYVFGSDTSATIVAEEQSNNPESVADAVTSPADASNSASPDPTDSARPTANDQSVLSPLAKITAFGSVLALVFWGLRLLARSMQSHQHLAADAHERRTMIMTYLAMLRRGEQVSENHLGLVLAGVFRPTSDGFVKEESGPNPYPLELLRVMQK